MGSKLTYRLKKSLLRTAKGRSALRHQEKQRVNRNKKIKMRKKCEDGLKILKAWKNNEAILMSIFSDHYNFFK